MHIKLNGKPYALAANMPIQALVEALQLNLRQIAIERNRAIVPRSAYTDTWLAEGDEVEIVAFIGGG